MEHEPGWDAKAIARIARKKFGGTKQMFEHYGWPERGSQMMTSQQRHVKEHFGSVLAFVNHHEGEK